jgi:hypothetical protein
MSKIKNLEIGRVKFDSGRMTDLNHFTKNMMLKPEVFNDAARLIFASRTNSMDLSNGNPIEKLFGLGKTRYIDSLDWEWETKVSNYIPITILESPLGMTSNSRPGQNNSDINVMVDKDLAQIGETWYPGASDKSQQCVVVDKKQFGRGFMYTFKSFHR